MFNLRINHGWNFGGIAALEAKFTIEKHFPSQYSEFIPIALLYHCDKTTETYIIATLADNYTQYASNRGIGTGGALVNTVTPWELTMDEIDSISSRTVWELLVSICPWDKVVIVQQCWAFRDVMILSCSSFLIEFFLDLENSELHLWVFVTLQ